MLPIEQSVIAWAQERGIFTSSHPAKQMLKTFEEYGELCRAVAKNDRDGIIDSIGDVLVTLILQAHMQGLSGAISFVIVKDVSELMNARDDGKFNKFLPDDAVLSIGDFLGSLAAVVTDELSQDRDQDLIESLCGAVAMLSIYAQHVSSTAQACLDTAYNVIRNRKGSMQNGVFVKEPQA